MFGYRVTPVTKGQVLSTLIGLFQLQIHSAKLYWKNRGPGFGQDLEAPRESQPYIVSDRHGYPVQGDHSGCAKPPVDIKTKVCFNMRSLY